MQLVSSTWISRFVSLLLKLQNINIDKLPMTEAHCHMKTSKETLLIDGFQKKPISFISSTHLLLFTVLSTTATNYQLHQRLVQNVFCVSLFAALILYYLLSIQLDLPVIVINMLGCWVQKQPSIYAMTHIATKVYNNTALSVRDLQSQQICL